MYLKNKIIMKLNKITEGPNKGSYHNSINDTIYSEERARAKWPDKFKKVKRGVKARQTR